MSKKTQLLASSAAAALERETVPEAGRVNTETDPATAAERGSPRNLDRELLCRIARRRRAARRRKKKSEEKSLDASAAAARERETVSAGAKIPHWKRPNSSVARRSKNPAARSL